MRPKDIIRIQIKMDTERYLANGGTIDKIDHTANHYHNQSKKRTRQQQIQYMKKHGQIKKR